MNQFDVIVVGAGPAGCTAACLLAEQGIHTLLVEEKRMPREKLCGAFIAPESFPTLHRLGVLNQILSAGAQRISTLRLIAPTGRKFSTGISAISASASCALSLSRSRFDQLLFDRARKSGAHCLDGMAAKRALFKDARACGVECTSLPQGMTRVFEAPLVVDASGRNSRLSLSRGDRIAGKKGTRLYALKADLENVDLNPETVELYFFPTGYGGLSMIERGLTNLCFLTTENSIKDAAGSPAQVLQETVMRNPAAQERLAKSRVVGKWLSAGPLFFGPRQLFRQGIIAVGDAAGMIDPFTGTGIQIALRSGEILAHCIAQALASRTGLDLDGSPEQPPAASLNRPAAILDLASQVQDRYETQYKAELGNRMAVSAALRLAALSPRTAGLLANLFAYAPGLVNRVFRSTRPPKMSSGPLLDQFLELSAPDSVSIDKVGISQGR